MSLLRIKQADGSWENIPAIKGADGADGKDGAIQYTAGRYIQIDENTQTINCTVKIGDLVIIDAIPVKDSTNVVSSGGVYDALETKADKTEIAGLGSEAGFITNSVEDLKNYYKKSETYSQEEVNSLLGNLTRLTLQVVQELPEVGTEHIIYLIPNNESGNNVFEEWIFIQSKWEMIGTTEVDLSNYYTKEEIDALIPSKDELLRMPYIMVSYSLNNNDAIQALGKLFTEHYKKYNTISTLMFGMIDQNASYTSILRWKSNWTGEGGRPTKVTFICLYFPSSDVKSISISEYSWNFSFDADGNISVGGVTVNPIGTISSSFLAKDNTTAFTPTSNYHPATKKYVDDKILDAIPQKGEMPEASADYLDKIYQYIGEDTEEFTKGFFYQCISETAEDGTVTYSWSELTFGEAGSSKNTNNIYEVVSSQNLGTSSSDFWSANDKVLEAMNKYLKGEIGIPAFRITAVGTNTTINSRDMYLRIGNIDNLTYNYFGSHLVIQEVGFEQALMLHSYRMTFTLVQDGTTGNYLLKGSISWDYNKRKVLAEGINASYTPTDDYNPATKKYVDEAVANAGGGGGDLTGYATEDYVNEKVNKLLPTIPTYTFEINTPYRTGYQDNTYGPEKRFEFTTDDMTSIETLLKSIQSENVTTFNLILINNVDKITHMLYSSSSLSKGVNTIVFRGVTASPSQKGALEVITLRINLSWSGDTFTVTGLTGWNTSMSAYSTLYGLYTMKNYFLQKSNTSEFTPTGDYNPATKKYVDDAIANAGGGSGGGADLSNYYNKEEVDAKVAPLVSATDVLTKTNTTEYTPASAYHPATKQYVDQTVASSGGITEESDPTVPLYVKNITQDMITKWNTVENKLTKEELSTSASEAGLITIDSINYPIVIKGRYNVDVVKYSGNETITPQILDYTIDESAMPFINAALKRFLKIKQDTGQSLIYTSSSFGDYISVYMPLDISLLVELLQDATIEYNDYDDANNSYTKTTAINSADIKAFTPSITNNLDGHRAVLAVTHYFDESYQSFDDITITFKEIYSDYNRKDISLRISSKINYNSEYDFELHTLSLRQNTALHVDIGTGTVIPTSTNDLNNNSGFITSDDLPEQLVIEGSVDDVYGKGNRILNPGTGSYSSEINKPNENAFAIGEFSTSMGYNTVSYGSGATSEGYNYNSRLVTDSGSGSGTEFTFENVMNSSHIRVGSKIYNDKLKKAYNITKIVEHESSGITYRDITVSRNSQDEDVFTGNNYIINSGGTGTHSEGSNCQAIGNCSHAEGNRAVATGYASHAQNDATTSVGNYSHAGGLWSEANAECSIAHGRTLINNVEYSALFGKYATLDAEADADVVFAIGNGNSYDDQNIGLKLVGAKGEGKLYVENTLIGADPSTYAGFDNTKTQVLKHINGVFTWVDE